MEKKDDKIKNEVLMELGLLERYKESGWKTFTAKETGRIGGLITKRKKLLKANQTLQA